MELLCPAAKFSSMRSCPTFREWLQYFISPAAVSEGSCFSATSPSLVIICLFDLRCPARCSFIHLSDAEAGGDQRRAAKN